MAAPPGRDPLAAAPPGRDRLAAAPPGPRDNAAGQRHLAAWRVDPFGLLARLVRRHGDIVGFTLGRTPCILVHGAGPVRELLLRHEGALRKPEFLKDSNRGHHGDGLTTLDGAAWQARRPLLRPAFQPAPVAARLPLVAECTRQMLARWPAEGPLDLAAELRLLTARIALRSVLDADIEGWGGPDDGARSGSVPLAEAWGEDYASRPGGDASAPWVMVRPRAPQRMDAVIALIDARLARAEHGPEDRGDVLSTLLRTAAMPGGAGLTRDAIVGEVIQMLYAGHLTFPTSLMNFWRLLAQPGADAAAARIAAEAAALDDAALTDPATLAASYAQAALKESLRLHPPAPLLYREVETDFELGGWRFARGTSVWVSPQLLHHDAREFEAPQCFRPERFLKGHPAAVRGAGFMPFGAGPRICIAHAQAVQQMSLIALGVARGFTLQAATDATQGFYVRARTAQPAKFSSGGVHGA